MQPNTPEVPDRKEEERENPPEPGYTPDNPAPKIPNEEGGHETWASNEDLAPTAVHTDETWSGDNTTTIGPFEGED